MNFVDKTILSQIMMLNLKRKNHPSMKTPLEMVVTLSGPQSIMMSS